MPNIKSAKKKMRQDVKRTENNATYEQNIKTVVKTLKKTKQPKAEDVKKAYSLIDKATKKRIIHKNKAARLKSAVSRLKK